MNDQQEGRVNKFSKLLKDITDHTNSVTKLVSDIVWGAVNPHLTNLFKQLDTGHVSKRVALYVSLGISIYSVTWAFEFAESTDRTGTDIATIIAAVMVPVNALTAAMFILYTSFKK